MWVCVCVRFAHLLYCYTLLCVCVCVCVYVYVYVCVCVCVWMCVSFALHWEFRAALFLCLTFLINISLPLLLSSPLFLSLPLFFLGHQNEVLSMLHHTLLKTGWLAGWLESRWDSMSAVKKLPPPDGCKQSFLLFVFNLYFSHSWLTGPDTCSHSFPAIHRGVVRCNKSLWHRVTEQIYWSSAGQGQVGWW